MGNLIHTKEMYFSLLRPIQKKNLLEVVLALPSGHICEGTTFGAFRGRLYKLAHIYSIVQLEKQTLNKFI